MIIVRLPSPNFLPVCANCRFIAVKTFDDYEAFLPRHKKFKQGHLHDPFMPADEVRQKLDQIKGHLVWMQLDFLCDAPMAEKGLQVNAYTESIYT